MSVDYSSDDESIDKISNVQLGFIDIGFEDLKDEKGTIPDAELPTIEDTFLGGKPVWLHPDSPPDEKLVTCDNCGNKLALYLQAFSPFKDKLYDRVIYIFGCKNTQMCSRKKGSIKCIRGIVKDPVKMAELKKQQDEALQKEMEEKLKLEAKTKQRDELTKDLFGPSQGDKGANPFDKGANPFDKGANPFDKGGNPFTKKEAPKVAANEGEEPKTTTYASVSAQNTPPKSPKKQSKFDLPEYPGYFVYVTKEKFNANKADTEMEKYKHLIETQSIEDGEGKGQLTATSSIANDPQILKIANMLEDKVFEHFSTTVLHNASQVLRYDIGGKPLLYNGKDQIFKDFSTEPFNIPRPGYNPSSTRQFELQLMPKAILDLEVVDNANMAAILNGMAWGTLIVCTDTEDYIPEEYYDENHVGYVEEYCGVQWEESV